jgi:hypothetical protein
MQSFPNQSLNNPYARPDLQTQQFPTQTQQQAPAGRPRGKTHGEVVSLRLEMAAYFRRPAVSLPETVNQ